MTNYILKDGVPVKEPDIRRWGKWFEASINERKVALTNIGDVRVSTVFLGTDHNVCERGLPVLYETLVFGGLLDQEMDRYTTRDEALLGHKKMVACVMKAEGKNVREQRIEGRFAYEEEP